MALKQYQSGGLRVGHKILRAPVNGQMLAIGIAFRTDDAPIGYLPFYGAKDFDFSGTTTFKEEMLARLPIDLSAAGSPHTLLIKAAAGDVEFLGSGDPDRVDIQQHVKRDLVRHAMACASGVFVDGVMLSLGGPTLRTLVEQLVSSRVKQFLLSKAISAAARKTLREQANFDPDLFLERVP